MKYITKQSRKRTYDPISNNNYLIIILLFGALLSLALFRVLPVMYTLRISFTNWNLYDPNSNSQFIGFKNYLDLLSEERFINAMLVTGKILLSSVPMSLVFGIILALIMYEEAKFSLIVRGIVITAMIVAPVVMGTTWKLMYNTGNGIFNIALQYFGFDEIPFLSLQSTALWAIVIANVWQESPFVMVIVLSGLYGVQLEVIEAAKVDGTNYFNRLILIVFPQIKKSIFLALLFRTIDSLKIFDLIWTMTKGGPGKATLNLNVLMYQEAFQEYQFGTSSAIAVINMAIIAFLCCFIIFITEKDTKG